MSLRLLAVCLVVVGMSPAAMEAFGQISGAVILAGVMDLQPDQVMIYAVGRQGGQVWEITCRWVHGRPAWIVFKGRGLEL